MLAYDFNKKTLCNKSLRFYHYFILNFMFYQISWKRKNKQLPWLPTPLVLLSYGSTVVTFNLWKYPLIRLAFAEINFRLDFFSQFWILTFFPRIYFCSSWNSRKFAWIYLRGCQNIYLPYKRKRMKELQHCRNCNESI